VRVDAVRCYIGGRLAAVAGKPEAAHTPDPMSKGMGTKGGRPQLHSALLGTPQVAHDKGWSAIGLSKETARAVAKAAATGVCGKATRENWRELPIPLNSDFARERAVAAILKAPKGYIASVEEPKRTLSQNDRLWAMSDVAMSKPMRSTAR
jgi:hypothetical protein